jgi:spermidine synthase
MTQDPRAFYFLLAIFIASGFAGLIYESVWAQYLRLFLGHAAYAQTMVLCIFMGGLALGAWLAARHTKRIRYPLLAYAAIEAAVGVFGLVFHGVFTRAIDFHYQHLLPLTSDPLAATTVKGLLALLLIGPQTVLLGATFPLMTAGVLRALPHASGHRISMLYFANSIGAAAGVLASVFIFIPWAGLPGTILTAGLINLLVALAVWIIVKRGSMAEAVEDFAKARPADAAHAARAHRQSLAPWLVLGAAAFTGMASFIYEVVWIRMLSLVLGASTHSFELMLSAFITGLALGSLAIRRWVDRIEHPYRALGYIQILMGLFALGSLWVYSESFHWMAALLQGLARTEPGYTMFLLASHIICFVIMLPATFMAGMTLPLITHGLLRDGYGERAVGNVYSINTLGSIAGVVLAIHFLIPMTGLKSALIVGGSLDILLGIALLAATVMGLAAMRPVAAVAASIAGIVSAALGVTLDPYKLNSGVYRYREAALATDTRFLYTGDGKTATISLYQRPDGMRVLTTNGKPDASLRPLGEAATADELTMILAGVIGMALHPEARTAANIGLGSGMTTQTLLRNPRLERVDSIEIEQKIVDAARLLHDRVGGIFTDPRSRIIVDDAKSYFAANRSRYDIIVAEPSNPWVSGVASLFTVEFYRRMLDHLTDRGVFVQWLQLYEIDHEAIASVMLALGRVFPNYTIYTTNDVDLLVVAWKSPGIREPEPKMLDWKELLEDLQRSNVEGPQDIEVRRIGGKAVMEPLFRSFTVPINSDYFPYLEHRAARARFRDLNASGYKMLGVAGLPIIEMLEGRPFPFQETRVAESRFVDRAAGMRNAMAAYQYLQNGEPANGMVGGTKGDLSVLGHFCRGGRLFDERDVLIALVGLSNAITPFLSKGESRRALMPLLQDKCLKRLDEDGQLVSALIERIVERDGSGMRILGDKLLTRLPEGANRRLVGFALDAAMLGAIASGDPTHAHRLWGEYGERVQTGRTIPIENRLMMAVAEVRMQRR